MVRRWRERWIACQATSLEDLPVGDRLLDAPRPGSPARVTAEQVATMIAVACEPPADSQRTMSHWTARELADEVRKRGIVDHISERHVARLLKRGISNRIGSATG